jgi:hypothetical protein
LRFWIEVEELDLRLALHVAIPVASVEDLLLKLVAFPPIDRADCLHLVRLYPRLDRSYCLGWVERLGLATRWEEVLQLAASDLV